MNRSTLFLSALIIAGLLVVGTMTVNSQANAAPLQDQQAAGIQYAQLNVDGQSYIWEPSGLNVQPRSFSLIGLYRSFGGQNRASFVNLLGEIGNDGWQLVDVSQDRTSYTFVK